MKIYKICIKNSNKKVFLALLILFSIIFIYYSNQYKSDLKIINNKYIDISNYKIVNVKHECKVFDHNEWIFNFDISQYTTIISLKENDQTIFTVESLIILNEQQKTDKTELSCFLKLNSQIIIQRVSEILNINSYFLKVKCSFDIKNQSYGDLNSNNIGLAIVNMELYEYYQIIFRNASNERLITFSKPLIIQKNKLIKTNKLVNCVHMAQCRSKQDNFDIPDEYCMELIDKIIGWSEILYRIGYEKIQIYAFRMCNVAQKELINKDKFHIIDIVDYKTNEDELCKWHKLELEKEVNNLNKFLYANCLNLVRNIFKMNDLIGLHEKINTNACYLKHKYAYEFMTNFDIDEIIFPRLFKTDIKNLDELKNISNQFDLSKYNMYDYAKRLIKIHDESVAFFSFPHAFHFSEHGELLNKIKQVNRSMSANEIALKFDNHKFVFNFTEQEIVLLDKYEQMALFANNLTQQHAISRKFYKKWHETIFAVCPTRAGKSLYITKNTFTINQHDADNVRAGTSNVNLKFEDGVAGHFREFSNVCNPKINKSISDISFDFEYFLFTLKILDISV